MKGRKRGSAETRKCESTAGRIRKSERASERTGLHKGRREGTQVKMRGGAAACMH